MNTNRSVGIMSGKSTKERELNRSIYDLFDQNIDFHELQLKISGKMFMQPGSAQTDEKIRMF